MDDEKLEIISQLMNFSDDELRGSMLIIYYWDDMVKENIVEKEDLQKIGRLTEEKYTKIKDFVSNKLQEQIERNNNGNKKKEKS